MPETEGGQPPILNERQAGQVQKAIDEGKIVPAAVMEAYRRTTNEMRKEPVLPEGLKKEEERGIGELMKVTSEEEKVMEKLELTPDPKEQQPIKRQREEQRKGERKKTVFDVNTKEELDKIIKDISGISDLQARSQQLNRLEGRLYSSGHFNWGSEVNALRMKLEKDSKVKTIRGIPENIDSDVEWRKWARARMAALLDPKLRETGKNPGNIFGATAETPFGRQNIDGSLYFPSQLTNEIHGESAADGKMLRMGEVTATNEIGSIYSKWERVHKNFKDMINVFDSGRPEDYVLPNNELNKFLLNDLKGEDGSEGGGSKNIAKALRIYWAIAHGKEEEGINILFNEGLEGIPNIFNTPLSTEARNLLRERVAAKCGGTYYESIGLMYASFLGVAAYGSDSTASGIRDVDVMGRLINSEINFYSNDAERDNPGKKGDRYLDDRIANAVLVYKNGNLLVRNTLLGKKYVPVRFAVHPGTLQIALNPDETIGKNFYFARDGEGSLVYKKKLSNGFIDTNETLDNLIKTGRINEVDWGKSDDLFALLKKRESLSIGLYKMFKNLDDDLLKLTSQELVSRKETFDNALTQYNKETRQNAAFLWLYSLINKNRNSWLKEDKNALTQNVVKDALKAGLISQTEAVKLETTFGIGGISEIFQPFRDQSYRPDNLIKGIFGLKK